MSMYALVFGRNPIASAIIATLGLRTEDFGRFRYAFISEGQIAVYTRCGGGNREHYQDMFDRMEKHPQYVRDADDAFDSTYATIYFNFPDAYAVELMMLDKGEKFDPSQRWLKAIEALREKSTPL